MSYSVVRLIIDALRAVADTSRRCNPFSLPFLGHRLCRIGISIMGGIHLTKLLLGRTRGHTHHIAFVRASNIKADGLRKLGSLTSPVSLLFPVAFKHTTLPSLRSTSALSACSALPSSSPSSPSSLSVSFFSALSLDVSADRCRFFVAVSLALASPLPVQAIKEMRENVIELSARDVPVDHEILHREVSADTESDTDLHVLAREHDTYGGSVPGVRVHSSHRACTCLT